MAPLRNIELPAITAADQRRDPLSSAAPRADQAFLPPRRSKALRLVLVGVAGGVIGVVAAGVVVGLISAGWPSVLHRLFVALGVLLLAAISMVGVRMLSYFHSFLLHWRDYRRLTPVTGDELAAQALPFVKIQITTRGSAGSTEVILRGIRQVGALVEEDPDLYADFLSIEVVTESAEQGRLLEAEFAGLPIPMDALVMPADYQTPKGTQMKARALHYAVERRRQGWNRKAGTTFVVHYDEESVMKPDELRKLIGCLATTDRLILEGPIYYPLEMFDSTAVCRTMEANRPAGCFECRAVMENGIPLHLHGSNLVVQEAFENELGWDMGRLDGQPFLAEDYIFGMKAFLQGGSETFGWHGAVMLEQPPFSFRSAFKQRHRWITGVLQGMSMLRRTPKFRSLSAVMRARLLWGTRFRVLTFALGAPIGAFSMAYLPFLLLNTVDDLRNHAPLRLPLPVTGWLVLVGVMWLSTVVIGCWYNLAYADHSPSERWTETARALTLAPVAAMLESSAGFWAVAQWLAGKHEVSWQPTPKSKLADKTMNWNAA